MVSHDRFLEIVLHQFDILYVRKVFVETLRCHRFCLKGNESWLGDDWNDNLGVVIDM
jgi:hypothetical protein